MKTSRCYQCKGVVYRRTSKESWNGYPLQAKGWADRPRTDTGRTAQCLLCWLACELDACTRTDKLRSAEDSIFAAKRIAWLRTFTEFDQLRLHLARMIIGAEERGRITATLCNALAVEVNKSAV